MLPAPIWPLAEHASFGQNCCDASIGSVLLFIIHSMPLDACFFQALLTFSPVSGELPLSKRIDAQLALGALEKALTTRDVRPGLIHHSDRGVHYASNVYVERLLSVQAR